MGVEAEYGFEGSYKNHKKLFGDYLTATARQKFDPPIEFEMVSLDIQGLFEAVKSKHIDFLYSNPGIYSCVGVEEGAEPLATRISKLQVRGHSYDLDVYGGVIFTLAKNDAIHDVADL